MEVGLWMLAGALVFDVIGVGKRQWANRVAAVLALGGMVRVLAPSHLGTVMRGWAHDAFQLLGELVGSWDPRWGQAVGSIGLALVATLVLLLWFLKLMPGHEQAGPASSQELDSRWIWGGAAVASLFVSVIPGALGTFFVAVTGLGAKVATAGIEHTVAVATVRAFLAAGGVA